MAPVRIAAARSARSIRRAFSCDLPVYYHRWVNLGWPLLDVVAWAIERLFDSFELSF